MKKSELLALLDATIPPGTEDPELAVFAGDIAGTRLRIVTALWVEETGVLELLCETVYEPDEDV